MNKAAIHFIAICSLLVSLFGCSDKAGNLLTDVSSSSTLASTISANTLTIEVPGLTKENVAEFARAKGEEGWDGLVVHGREGQPAVVTLQKKIVWDGVSPMEKGKLYGFTSEEDYQKSQEITDKLNGIDITDSE